CNEDCIAVLNCIDRVLNIMIDGRCAGNVRLTETVVTPGGQGPIGAERQAVTASGRNGDGTAQVGDRVLVQGVSPGDDCTVGFERQIVGISRSDGYDAGHVVWYECLSVIIVVNRSAWLACSPTNDRAIRFDRQTVQLAGGNTNNAAQTARNCALG